MSAVLWTLGTAPDAEAKKVRIKLGTLAPEGSAWHERLLSMATRWNKATGGQVELKIYPGGVAGDEGDMVRKMRIGQLHAAMLTGVGLGQIDRAPLALQVPMMFESWEELDYVRDRVAPEIGKELEGKGFKVVQWGDAGWVYQFSKEPATTPQDFFKLKLYVWSGDSEAEKIWRSSGFNPVPLSVTDVLAGLQTGMVQAFGTTSLHALSAQWFGVAQHMVKVKWSALNGATVVSQKAWDDIDPKHHAELLKIAAEESVMLNQAARSMDDKAIKAMVDRGLKVVEPSPEVVAEWRKVAEKAYPELRGPVIPEKYFAKVAALVAEYRAKNGKGLKKAQ